MLTGIPLGVGLDILVQRVECSGRRNDAVWMVRDETSGRVAACADDRSGLATLARLSPA